MSHKKILVIDDEIAIRDMIHFSLKTAAFDVIEAGNVKDAMIKLAESLPELILLDWMLPDMSGIDFLKKLRSDSTLKNIPIIMLTAKAEEENKIKGLDSGADDYITKPFSPRELIARINSLLRRGPLITPEGVLQFQQLQLNVNTYQVTINNVAIELSSIEYKLLYFFLTHQERIYNRHQLLDHVWGPNHFIEERTVDVVIRRLRDRLKPHHYDQYIKTIRHIGYQFSGK